MNNPPYTRFDYGSIGRRHHVFIERGAGLLSDVSNPRQIDDAVRHQRGL